MKLYESFFFSLDYFPSELLLVVSWTEKVIDVTDDEIKDSLLKYLFYFEKYKPKRVLFDAGKALYPFTPDMFQWVMDNIAKVVDQVNDDYAVAYVLPGEFLIRVNMEQLINRIKLYSQKKRKVFVDKEKSLEWLLKGQVI